MKPIFSILALFPLFCVSQLNKVSQDKTEGINFMQHLPWNEIVKKAQSSHKFIFVDCYTTWCSVCKEMDNKIYLDKSVASFVNRNFISIKLQMDKSKYDNEEVKKIYNIAREIKQRFKITVFPTFLFFSPTGKIVHKEIGFKSVVDFLCVARDAMDQNIQYYTLLEKYQQSRLDTGELKKLAFFASYLEEPERAEQIANDYLNRLTTDQLLTKENVSFMYTYTKRSKERGFKFFMDSAYLLFKVDDRITKDVAKDLVKRIIYTEEMAPYEKNKNDAMDWKKMLGNLQKYDSLGRETFMTYRPNIIFKREIQPALIKNSSWNNILILIKKQNAGNGEEFLVGSTLIYYLNGVAFKHTENSCSNLISAALYYKTQFSSYVKPDPLNNWAWVIFNHSFDTVELHLALEWAKEAMEEAPSVPEYIDTYANILYKLKKTEAAILYEEKAIGIDQSNAIREKREPDNLFVTTLGRMKRGEETWSFK